MHATKLNLPKLIAHRGASHFAPENTLAAVREAKKLGASWVEFDVRLTKDNELICFHDDELNRTTNGNGLVCDRTYAALMQLDAGSWFAPKFRNEPIPTFAQMATLVTQLDMGMNIEIKPDLTRPIETAQKTIDVLKQLNIAASNKILMSSFNFAAIEHIVKNAPEYPTGLLIREFDSTWHKQADLINAQTVHISKNKIDKYIIKEIHDTNRLVLVYTVNDAKEAQLLFDMGVDCIFSDVTDLLDQK